VQWTEHNAVPIVSNPSEVLLADASASGVLLAVEIGLDAAPQDVRRLAQYSSVGVIVASESVAELSTLKSAAPNVIFARKSSELSATDVANWADLRLIDTGDTSDLRQSFSAKPLPIVAVRRLETAPSFAAARAECDRLQRDLAPIGDFAGYIV